MRVAVAVVRQALFEILVAAGVPKPWATRTADHLVEGDLRGQSHHGIGRIHQILDGFRAGTLRPDGELRTAEDRPGLVVVDADGCLGVPAADHAVKLLEDRVADQGMAAAGVRNAGHLGVLAPFAERLANDGCLAVVVSTTEPAATAPGGRTKVLGTNPIAFACPSGTGILSADFATTSITRGELLSRAARGEPLPPGVAVDASGRPTTDATAALAGGLLSFDGSMKGFLISVLLSVIAGPAIGARMNHLVTGTRKTDVGPTKGDLFLAIDVGGRNDFATQVQSFFDLVSSETDVRVPGSAAFRRRSAALRDGIMLTDAVRTLLEPYC